MRDSASGLYLSGFSPIRLHFFSPDGDVCRTEQHDITFGLSARDSHSVSVYAFRDNQRHRLFNVRGCQDQ